MSFSKRLSVWLLVGIITGSASSRAGADPGWWINREAWFDGDVFWSVGRGSGVDASDSDSVAKMNQIVAAHLASLGQQYDSVHTASSDTAEYLSRLAGPCASEYWIVDHSVSPGSSSTSSLARLDRKTVLECVETRNELDPNLRRFIRVEAAKSNHLSGREKYVQMTLSIDSVERRWIPIYSMLIHWYTHKTFIKGTIHGEVIDASGKPVGLLGIKAVSNSWPRNPAIRESLSPTRGDFPGDQTEFSGTTDADGRFELPFSGYVGIRDFFRITFPGLETIFIHREKNGHIFAKYLIGYARIPIAKQ